MHYLLFDVLGLLFFAILAVFMYSKKKQYHITLKLFSYFIGLLFIYRLCRQDKKSVNLKFNNFRSEYPSKSSVSAYPARFLCSFR